jgi:hypothetical protein
VHFIPSALPSAPISFAISFSLGPPVSHQFRPQSQCWSRDERCARWERWLTPWRKFRARLSDSASIGTSGQKSSRPSRFYANSKKRPAGELQLR